MTMKRFCIAFIIISCYALNTQAQRAFAAVKIGGKWGYLDNGGNLAIPIKFEGVGEQFSDGLAWAKSRGKFGYINTKGKWAIKPKFDTAVDFHRGWGLVKKDTAWFMLDKKGKIVMKCITFKPYEIELINPYSYGRALVTTTQGYGFIDMNGLWLLEPQFEYAEDFSDGVALVRSGGKIGYIDTTGKFIIPAIYNTITGVLSTKERHA
jgi:hypothetical protein